MCWSSHKNLLSGSGYNLDKPVDFYGLIVPPGPNAPSSECLLNVVPNSEFRTCRDLEFPNALHSEFRNTPNVEFLNVPLQRAYVIPCQQQMRSSDVLRARRSALVLAAWTGVSRSYLRYGGRGRIQIVSNPSFLFELSWFFLQYTGDTDAKNDGPEFWNSKILWFFRFFLNFQKASRGPSVANFDHCGHGQTRSQ